VTATTQTAGWPLHPAGRIALLDVDPDLAGRKSGSELAAIRDRLTAPVYRLATGTLPEPPAHKRDSHLGFLLLKGLLLYEVSACGRATAELLGPGDLIRPWGADVSTTLASDIKWTVLEQALVADLGSAASSRFAETTDVLEALVRRCADRAEAVAIQRSITAHVRVDVRVLAYLWHLADRFGVVTPGAVKLDVPLTHAVLARLVGARRPTVTTALQRLMQLGYLRRDGRAFVLVGDPSAVLELESRSPARDFALPDGTMDGAMDGSADGARVAV
jgi:CRP/FNR family transcriptional regulator, cyclic AMP receptor protein